MKSITIPNGYEHPEVERNIPERGTRIICDSCGKRIRSKRFWYRRYNGKVEFYCRKCARNMVDERVGNGLLSITMEVNNGKR